MGERATIDQDYLYDIADAIREKKGVTTRFIPAQMKPAILSIPTGGITPTGTVNITQNGTHDVTQYANANVNVQPTLQSKTATQNGTVTPDQGYDGLSSVVVKVSGGTTPDVPSGYTRLNYIESTGEQYIDTGVSDANGMFCQARACFVEAVDIWDAICMGQDAVGAPPANGLLARYSNTNKYGIFVGTDGYGSLDTGIAIQYGVMTDLFSDTRNSAYYLNTRSSSKIQSKSGTRGTRNLYLFASSNGGTPSFYSKSRIDYIKLYNSSGTLVRDFRAVMRDSDSTLGMWDAVSETFFTNGGSGAFVSGGAR